MKKQLFKYQDRKNFARAFIPTPIYIADEQVKVEDKQYSRQTLNSHGIHKLVRGFSFIELQITLVVLAIGLWSFAGLFRVYSRQISYIEKYSEPNMYNPDGEPKGYWFVGYSDEWMRRLGIPADIKETAEEAGQPPSVLQPDVNNNDRQHFVQLYCFDLSQASADVNVH